MKEMILLFGLIFLCNIAFAQNADDAPKLTINKEVMTISSTAKTNFIETAEGYKMVIPKEKVYDLDAGIAVHPDAIVSDKVIAKQIATVENDILMNKDNKEKIFQLNKKLVNLKAKRKYLKDNNLN